MFVVDTNVSAVRSVLQETPRHHAVVEEVLSSMPWLRGNALHDTHTAVLMREHGLARIYTRDSDFHRFSFVDVVDPLVGSNA